MQETQPQSTTQKTHLEMEALNPFEALRDILSANEIEKIKKVSGPWKEYYRNFVSQELDLQASKVQRLERTFGEGSIEVSKAYKEARMNYGVDEGRNQKYYAQIKGRALNRFETIASYDESEAFLKEALIAYVGKGLGQDVQNFATNLKRVPTMRESGFYTLMRHLKERGLITETFELGFTKEQQKKVCPPLLAKATAAE